MGDINVNNDYKDMLNLTPFKACVLQNFPFIEADFDAVTNYQLLCKVVEYLNKLIDNSNKQNNNITQLQQNFITLYNYVKGYFDNLDVQEEINKKLDEMTADGTLGNIIEPFFKDFKKFISEQNDKITVLENRMNTFSSLPGGSTSGDAELIDIRVPASGFNNNKAYSTAGDAVRGQVSTLKNNIDNLIINGKNLILGRSLNGYNIDITYNKKTGATNVSGISNNTGRIILTPEISLILGEYTLSCEYQITSIYKPVIYVIENSTKQGIFGYGGTVIAYLGVWDKVTKFTINENKNVSIELYFQSNANYGADCYIQLEKGDKTDFEPYMYYNAYGDDFVTTRTIKELSSNKIDFSNMIMNCMGDSLTYGYINSTSRLDNPYPALLEKNLNLKKCNNYGITGSTIANRNENSMCNRISGMENGAKIISVLGGTNDKTNNVPLGDITSVDDNVFYGALKSIVTQLISKYGSNYTTYNVFIFLITPTHSSISDNTNNLGLTLNDYREAIINVGAFYGIPVLDLYALSRLSQNTVGYTYDGVHWKQDFVNYLIEPIIRNFIINNMFYPLF